MEMKTTRRRAADEVVEWRREQLVGSGFAPSLAKTIAGDPSYDLHALIELIERGCHPAVAVRILAPLEQASAA
jgi:hypothetical protein